MQSGYGDEQKICGGNCHPVAGISRVTRIYRADGRREVAGLKAAHWKDPHPQRNISGSSTPRGGGGDVVGMEREGGGREGGIYGLRRNVESTIHSLPGE